MKKLTATILSGFCAFLACQQAQAFNNAGTVSLNVGGGYDYYSSTRPVKNSGAAFGIIGYNFTDNWGIEGLLGFFTTKSNANATYNQNVDGKLFAVDAVYHFSPFGKFQPYLLAGPGATEFDPSGTDANYAGNVNAAVGGQYFFTDIVALRLELRDFYTIVGGRNDVMVSGGVTLLINT